MINKNEINSLGYETIEHVFEYIWLSFVNDNTSWKEISLIEEMSVKQKESFRSWLYEREGSEVVYHRQLENVIEHLDL